MGLWVKSKGFWFSRSQGLGVNRGFGLRVLGRSRNGTAERINPTP